MPDRPYRPILQACPNGGRGKRESPAAPVTADAYRATWAVLAAAGADLPILPHGQGGSVRPIVRLAVADGYATRIGFEDGLTLPGGTPAASIAELVAVPPDAGR